jgi:methylated-DNA-[protein]-cysteine S-methyltransferase
MKKHELLFYTITSTSIGEIALTASEAGLSGVYNCSQPAYRLAQKGVRKDDFFAQAVKQLNEYFAGSRTQFDLTLELAGSPFQIQVWNALQNIPYGTVANYGKIAANIGMPQAARAVGGAISKNPVSIIVPCHRVIGINGKLTGYAGGLATKEWLLNHERCIMPNY